MGDSDDDLEGKSFGDDGESDDFSQEKKLKDSISADNSKKKEEKEKSKEKINPNKEEDKKKDAQKEQKKKKEESSDDEDSSEENRKNNKKDKDKKEDKKSDDSSSSSSDSDSKNKEKEKQKEKEKDKEKKKDKDKEDEELIKDLESDEEKDKKKKEKEDKEKKEEGKKQKEDKKREEKEKEEKEKKKKEEEKKQKEDKKKEEKEKEEKEKKKKEEDEKRRREEEEKRRQRQEDEKRRQRQEEDRRRNDYNQRNQNNDSERNNNYGNNSNFNYGYRNNNYREYGRNNNYGGGFNQNPRNEDGSYQQRKPKKFDLNETKALNKIIDENKEIINEMKSAYPGITRLECASVFKKIKTANSQTIFEMMNQIHREICTQITLNEVDNRNQTSYILPIDPYEVIDPFYNNPDHIKVMKFFKVYSKDDIDKLPQHISILLKKNPHYLYETETTKRRKLVKYSDGGFNYIPIKCNDSNCKNENCPYSHNDLEMEFHPLFYKTKFSSHGQGGILDKWANNLKDDFRIIYNYKNQNIINLLKLLDEKKIAKSSFKDLLKNKINSFELDTFKIIECPSVKSGISCSKDSHLCYFYHTPSERRRPPSLYRYTNEMCPDQKYSDSGKVRNRCENGDFCNLCHSRYEFYYHKLFFGKAMTCLRPKKNGKCIYEETCYAYHPYKEPGYKKTREEIIQEKKDELMDKYNEEYDLLSGLISKFKCQNCKKFKKKLIYYYLVNCEHIICKSCFAEKAKKKCPICKEKFDHEKEGEDYVIMDIKKSSENIDELILKNYEEKKEKNNQEKNNEKKEEEKKEDIKEEKKDSKEKKDDKNKEKDDDKSENDEEKSENDDGKENNNSMG